MSIRWMDGFDRYGTSGNVATALSKKYSVGSVGAGINVATGRYNGYGLTFGYDSKSGHSFIKTGITGFTGTKMIIGFNCKTPTTARTNVTLFRDNYNSWPAYMVCVNNNEISIVFNNSTVYSYSATSDTWYQVEWVMNYSSIGSDFTTGTMQLYINGSLVYTSGSVSFNHRYNISGAYPLAIDTFNSGGNSNAVIDNFYILDDIAARGEPVDRIGSTARISTLYPSAAKNGVDVWTPTNAASATLAVKQVPIGAAYITAPSSNSVQEFEFDDLPISFTDVKGLQFNTMASGDTGATYKHMVNNSAVLTTTLITTPTLRTTPLTVIDTTAVNAIQAGVSS